MYDIVAIGELLIDFTPNGITENGTLLFGRNAGGAPGNVLSMAAGLGRKTALIAKVGEDQFGEFLTETLGGIGVDTQGIVRSKKAHTTLAFVHLNATGERNFSFCRKPGADMLLEIGEVDRELITGARIFHFGTVSMTDDPSRSATLEAVKAAKEHGAIISFDPNLRLPLWKGKEEARAMIETGLAWADVLKISDEELEFITGLGDLERGSEVLYARYGIPVILVTLGAKGCYYRTGEETGTIGGYAVETVDTTGAGDAFLGTFLAQLVEKPGFTARPDKAELERMIDFANGAGALVTTRIGAICAMPALKEIKECMARIPK